MSWNQLTQPQATLLGTIVTGIIALLAIFLTSKILDGKVKSLERAIETSGSKVKNHLDDTEASVRKASDEIKNAIQDWKAERAEQNEIVESISEQVINIANAQAELAPPEEQDAEVLDIEAVNPIATVTWEDVRRVWADIQETIEAAARAEPDGRRRAKYARQDRRSYDGIINVMEADNNLTAESAAAAREALQLRNRLRRRNQEPTGEELQRLLRLRDAVVGR